MKFGQKIKTGAFPEWKYYYMDYDASKKMLKEGHGDDGQFTEDDEANFVQKLEAELEKVAAFRKIKGDELLRRLQHCESMVRKILSSSTSDDVNRFSTIENEISRITIEVNELSKFIRLNYTGFLKILKKHDKHMTFILKPMFNVRLASHPFYKESFDPLIIRLSKLYDTVRTGGERDKGSIQPPNNNQTFVRRTTKYWVHPDDVTEVKCIILKHLPVLVFSGKNNQDPNPAITSIYFDNDQFELYQGRIEKTEGAQAVRIRWYGGMEQTEIFVERKTHREDWTGESSVKSRFSIKEKYVADYIKGNYTMDKAIQKMKDRGQKSPQELEDLKQLADEVQATISEKNLHPMVRTFYNRTAFQLPGDARVRISLDTELTMVREDNYDSNRSGDNWRRMDMGIDFPFNYLPSDDVSKFPYAILEVKLQTQHGTQAPKWVDELVKSHLVEEVPKFSKFIHGVATLLEKRVSLLPFWLPQMDKSIKKPAPPGYISQLSGKTETTSLSTSASFQDNSFLFEGTTSASGPSGSRTQKKSKLIAGGGGDVEIQIDNDDTLEQEEGSETQPLLGGANDYGDDYSSSAAQTRGKNKKRKKGGNGRQILGRIGNFFSATNSGNETGNASSSSPLLRRGQQQGQKRIVLPVRVEPKVFFANERTFLSWIHFCIVLGTLALGLMNFGDRVGMISGLIFTIVAMLFMLYALFLFQWRAHKIRNRDPGPYDDRLGPTVLVVALFFAVVVNFYLRFTST